MLFVTRPPTLWRLLFLVFNNGKHKSKTEFLANFERIIFTLFLYKDVSQIPSKFLPQSMCSLITRDI